MAIRRSLGLRLLTTWPPMRISPAVGCSRPAIIRRRVVLPEPDGPRKTRNSPSRVTRFTLLTAPSSPCLNTLVRSRVSTTAIKSSWLFPSVPNTLVLGLCCLGGVFGGFIATGNLGKHGGNHPGLEGLINSRRSVAGIADIGGPAQHIAQYFVLVSRIGAGIVADFLLQVGNGAGEAGEIVKLAIDKPLVEAIHVVD